MRLVYLFVADGPAPTGSNISWDDRAIATNPYVSNGMYAEGFFYLLNKLVNRSIVDEVLIIVESTKGTGRHLYLQDGVSAYVLPEIEGLDRYLRPDDVIFCRHGFRTWFPFLQKASEDRRWILFYRAASNRGPWPFWDVILEDCIEQSFVDNREMLHLQIAKPTNPVVFYLMGLDRPYDVCIGASHIHDKKAQWKTIKVLAELQRKYNRKLRCVLPGRVTGGEMTREMLNGSDLRELDVTFPGMVDRAELAIIMNHSKLFVHLGGAGQNDRGVLEAMCCGCQPVLANVQYHAPFTYTNKKLSYVIKEPENLSLTAAEIRNVLDWWEPSLPWRIAEYYNSNADVDSVIVPQFKRLFEVLGSTQKSDRRLLRDAYDL